MLELWSKWSHVIIVLSICYIYQWHRAKTETFEYHDGIGHWNYRLLGSPLLRFPFKNTMVYVTFRSNYRPVIEIVRKITTLFDGNGFVKRSLTRLFWPRVNFFVQCWPGENLMGIFDQSTMTSCIIFVLEVVISSESFFICSRTKFLEILCPILTLDRPI